MRPHRFQHLPHDHVLREHERKRNAFAKVCHYILKNPFKAELISRGAEWRFSGAVAPGYPTLNPMEEDFWPKFWKLYLAVRAPDAGNIKRPPL